MHNEDDEVQLYTPLQFDEASAKRGRRKELTEEEITARVLAREDAGYAEGLEKGRVAGYEDGLKRSEREVRETVARLGNIIGELEGFRQKKLFELFPSIINLALDIAKKVVHKEIELDENIIMHVAREAMKRAVGHEDQVLIKVNPLDYEVIMRNLERLTEETGINKIVIETTPGISTGGCIIETKSGEIDASIEGQMEELEDGIGGASTPR